MKKLLLIAVLFATCLAGYSQLGGVSVIGKLGYQTDYERVMLGVEGRYNFTSNLRIAPDVLFFFPKHDNTGLDVNINLHYTFALPGDFTVYPLAGLAIQNNSGGDADSYTDFGFNLGGGLDYSFSPRSFLSVQAKYTFSDSDNALFSIGYGYRF